MDKKIKKKIKKIYQQPPYNKTRLGKICQRVIVQTVCVIIINAKIMVKTIKTIIKEIQNLLNKINNNNNFYSKKKNHNKDKIIKSQ